MILYAVEKLLLFIFKEILNLRILFIGEVILRGPHACIIYQLQLDRQLLALDNAEFIILGWVFFVFHNEIPGYILELIIKRIGIIVKIVIALKI